LRGGGVGGLGFDFNILTALKGWVGLAPQGPGALHIYKIYRPCALHIIII